MTPLQAIAVIAVNLLRGSGDKLTLKTVQAWIKEKSNRDNYGSGYSGNRLSRGPSNGFAEIVKQPNANGKHKVTAAVYLDPRQGAVASKTWDAQKLDSDLEKLFGKNLRVRIDV